MVTYEEKLERAKATTVLTDDVFFECEAVDFDENMGLWVRQESEGGGIAPYAWQMQMADGHDFVLKDSSRDTVNRLFRDLGHGVEVDAYERRCAAALTGVEVM